MTQSSPLADHADDIDYIQHTLKARPLICSFPLTINTLFLSKRVEDSSYYIRSGQWLLLLMFSVIGVVAWTFYRNLFIADHFHILKFIEIPLGLSILFIIYGHQVAGIREHFHRVMFPVAVFQITIIHLLISLSTDSGYFIYAVFNQMMTMLLIALGIRFTTQVLAFIYALSGCFGLIINNTLHLPIDYLAFCYYFVLYGLVVIALAGIAERQERFAFLQELLVSYQTKELAHLNQKLDRIAHEDALTGIANRRSFNIALEREWEVALREQRSLSLLLMDVDFFKRYNDTYGHENGDQCLQAIAQAIHSAMMRPADLAARYGGEEFVVLMPDTATQGAMMVAERILLSVDDRQIPHASSTAAPHVTLSIGITTLTPNTKQTLQDAIRQADEALYKAKEKGRHQYQVYVQ